MYPSGHFFLKALFLRGPSAEFGGLRGFQAQGCVAKEPFESSNLLAMDFSRAGVVEALEGVFRARVQCYRRRRVANRHVLAEGYMDKTLVSIPFPNTALAMYLLIGFP